MTSYTLPDDHRPYNDKYFLNSSLILEKENMNPTVTYQYFIRKGPGKVYGIDEALAMLRTYADIPAAGGEVWALPEASEYQPEEPIMHVTGPAQQIIELETLCLSAISGRTTWANAGEPELLETAELAARLRQLAPDKQLIHFGARHYQRNIHRHWRLGRRTGKGPGRHPPRPGHHLCG